MRVFVFVWVVLVLSLSGVSKGFGQRWMERLDRGTVAVRQDTRRVFISWRLLGDDAADVLFHVYRQPAGAKAVRLTRKPLQDVTWFVDSMADLRVANTWYVEAIQSGRKPVVGKPTGLGAAAPVQSYLEVPLQTPVGYTPNDASVGDLDGDGVYDLVVHMTGVSHDNSHKGVTDPPILQGYTLRGKLLWTINLGKNIREGAHYTQFMVYDLDGDGRAEVVCKTADGSADGSGRTIGDATADHRNASGYILRGSEYLTVFDGLTGSAKATVPYIPSRYDASSQPTEEQLKAVWGDGYGNRMDRFLACIAYLDGARPSVVMARGYYTRMALTAWSWGEGRLSPVWQFDTDSADGGDAYRGQGNHNLSVADVDGDGRDEIVYGACVIDDTGKGLYSTGLGHGDALHVSDLDPDRTGLEIFDIQERFDDAGCHLRDARTGEILWKKPSAKAGEDGEGPGRGNAFDIDPRYRGHECWVKGAGISGLFSVKGTLITEHAPASCNFGVWWDGDLLRELLDGTTIAKWDWEHDTLRTMVSAEGCLSNNGTKATPVLSADLFGDWREEVIWRTADNRSLRIYTTTIPTRYRFRTLMHDPVYRLGVAWQNVGYNQPPHTGYYLGEGMAFPPAYTPVRIKR